MKSAEEIIFEKNWPYLVKNFLPVNCVDILSFTEVMLLADSLIDASADQLDPHLMNLMRDFAVNLLIILRAREKPKWQEDWKNEVFLGILCGLVFRTEEAFQYIQNAYREVEDPPQSLIFSFIAAAQGPESPLSFEEVEKLTLKGLEKGITYEAALRMATLMDRKGDKKQAAHWEKQANIAKRNSVHTKYIKPSVLRELISGKEREKYEE